MSKSTEFFSKHPSVYEFARSQSSFLKDFEYSLLLSDKERLIVDTLKLHTAGLTCAGIAREAGFKSSGHVSVFIKSIREKTSHLIEVNSPSGKGGLIKYAL